MQRNLTSYVKTIEGNLFQFICEPNAQTAQAKEFLFEVIKWIGDIEAWVKSQKEQAQQQKSDVSVTDEVKHEEVA